MLLTQEIRLILLRQTTGKVKGVGVHAAFTVGTKLAVSMMVCQGYLDAFSEMGVKVRVCLLQYMYSRGL